MKKVNQRHTEVEEIKAVINPCRRDRRICVCIPTPDDNDSCHQSTCMANSGDWRSACGLYETGRVSGCGEDIKVVFCRFTD